MTKTILISGGEGKLAQEIIRCAKNKYNIIAPSHGDMSTTDIDDLCDFIEQHKPNYFIHAAALTRPLSVHDEQPVLSVSDNILGTCEVVIQCIHHNIKLIYISTDYVYPGYSGNYTEEDAVLPFTKYGWSKLGGECAVRLYDNSLILRACLCEHPFPHEYALTDIQKNYIYHKDAAPIIIQLLDKTGIINIGGPSTSPYDFTKQQLKPTTINQLGLDIKTNTTMNISRMKNEIS